MTAEEMRKYLDYLAGLFLILSLPRNYHHEWVASQRVVLPSLKSDLGKALWQPHSNTNTAHALTSLFKQFLSSMPPVG